MNTLSDKEKIKAIKAAPKLNAGGSMAVTINGQVAVTARDMYILSRPDKGFVAFIKEGQGALIVRFPLLVEPGTYEIEKHEILIELDYNGLEDVAKTGALTLETLVPQKLYKGSFDVKTVDHQKIEGVFEVRIL
ncbi:hypothetical protein ACEI36_25105 [Pseudomonas kielensis]|uniref:hypothetical protein n=1 Tax=Pseudomonas kielensis TaxID=2762577 RepID=UPI0038AF61A4